MKQAKWILAIAVVLILLLLYGAYNGKNKPDCAKFPTKNCPLECVICPPCETCSSLVCRSEEYCTGIGFNRSWSGTVRPK